MRKEITTAIFIILAGVSLLVGAISFGHAEKSADNIYFYLVGLFTWIAASLTLMEKPESSVVRLSYLMSLGFMNICFIGVDFTMDVSEWRSLFVPFCQFFSVAILPCLLAHSFCVFPLRKKFVTRKLLGVMYIPGIVLFILMGCLYLRAQQYKRAFFLVQIKPIGLINAYVLLAYSIFAHCCLFHTAIRAPSAYQRKQAKWLFIGLSAGLLPLTIFVTVPVMFTGMSSPYGNIAAFTLIMIPICYCVAIIRYRLMDLELIINRGLVYGIVSGLVIILYLLTSSVLGLAFASAGGKPHYAVSGVALLISAMLFAPAKSIVETIVDRAFYRQRRTYRETVLLLSEALSSILDLDKLLETILSKIMTTMQLENGAIFLWDEQKKTLEICEPKGLHPSEDLRTLQFSYGDGLLEQLTKDAKPIELSDKLLLQDYLARSDGLKAAIKYFPNSAWVPFVAQKRLIGLLVLGKKLSGDRYSNDDLSLFSTLAYQGAIAIENAVHYAQLQERTETMEKAYDKLRKTYQEYGGTLPQVDDGNLDAAFADIAEKLKEIDESKTQLLSNISHDLKTPLASIMLYVNNLLKGVYGELAEKQTDCLARIKNKCDELVRLVNDLLDLSRIALGTISLQKQTVALCDVIEEVVSGLKHRAEAKGISLTSSCDGILKITVDPDRLKRILNNLLDNALKFTESGSVTVDVTDKVDNVEISVSDTGIGIPESELENIFDRFYRVFSAENTRGVGLGLAITKSLVELHGGKIGVESEVGKGSRFYMTFSPLEP